MKIHPLSRVTVLFICFFCSTQVFSQKWEWLTGGGAKYDQRIRSVAVDISGNTYAVGSVNDSLIIQGNLLVMKSAGLFLAKFDAKGKLIFLKGFGSGSGTVGQSIAYDKKGYLYFTGNYSNGKIVLGTTTLTTSNSNANRPFLAKMDLNGNCIWAININDGNSALSYKIKYNEKDSTVAVGGYYQGTAKFYIGKDSFVTNGSYDLFIAAFNSINGNLKWFDIGGTKNYDALSYIEFDESNNVYMSFLYQKVTGTDTFKTRSVRLPVTSGYDAGLVKYSPKGKLIWQKSVSGNGDQHCRGMRMGIDNNLYMVIYSSYNNSINFFGTNYKVNYQYENILIKMDTAGVQLKRKEAYVAYLGSSSDIERDSLGYLYILGANSFKFDNANAIGNGNSNFFLIKMDTSLFGIKATTGGKNVNSGDLTVTADGTCIVGGSFDWIKDSVFKTGTYGYRSRGDEDCFLASWNFEDSCKKPKPVISYTKFGNTYYFKDLGKIQTDTRNWKFDPGKSDTAKAPSFLYPNPGIYTVTLVAGNQCGRDSAQVTLYHNCVPKAYIKSSISGKTVMFSDSSTSTSRIWNFGDGKKDTSLSPTHVYGSPGYYDVSLIVSNACGSDTAFQRIYIECSAKSTFGYQVSGRKVSFTDSSIYSNARIWDFGDGSTDTTKDPVHSYPGNGTYKIVLKSFGICFNDSSETLIQINCSAPVSDFIYTDTNLLVRFINTTVNPERQIWYLGDQNTDTSLNPVHLYATDKTYEVKLVSENYCSRDSVIKQLVLTCPKPVIEFNHSATGRSVNFFGITNSYQVNGWLFDFGDGKTSTGQLVSHEYEKGGEYTVMATAGNRCGLDTFSVTFTVECETKAKITFTSSGARYWFKDSSLFGKSRTWYFGDGFMDTAANPFHMYANNGKYTVKLLIVGSCGKDSMISEIEVDCEAPKPEIHSIIEDKKVSFSAKANKPGVTAWNWEFGDGTSDTSREPEHVYLNYGTYLVKLRATSDCRKDSSSTSISIKQGGTGKVQTAQCAFMPGYLSHQGKIAILNSGCNLMDLMFEMYDTKGELLIKHTIPAGESPAYVPVPKLSGGVYHIRIYSENNGVFHQNLFIKND